MVQPTQDYTKSPSTQPKIGMAYVFERHRLRDFLLRSVASNFHEILKLSFVLRENVCLRKSPAAKKQ